ncbi:unnamed protein product [Closterium sp. NIES-65]|nr:unnamed protein product [Closterium sp. NIES-65]
MMRTANFLLLALSLLAATCQCLSVRRNFSGWADDNDDDESSDSAARPAGLMATAEAVDEEVTATGGRVPRRARLSKNNPQVKAYAQMLQTQQAQIASEVGVASDKMAYSYKYSSNGFSAELTAEQLRRLKRHPAVASVRPSARKRLFTTESPTFLGMNSAGSLWPANGGQAKAGDGTVIAIVDTGIWPEHPSFSDTEFSSSRPAGWSGKCDTTKDFKCNNKLIGARAFYKAYKSANGLDLSGDWLSPRDANGHGTWCAGAAAGNKGVPMAGGKASGMAPAARLVAYKVFWSSSDGMWAEEADIIAAVNQGVADGVDVISLSLGAVNPEDTYFDDIAFLNANLPGVPLVTLLSSFAHLCLSPPCSLHTLACAAFPVPLSLPCSLSCPPSCFPPCSLFSLLSARCRALSSHLACFHIALLIVNVLPLPRPIVPRCSFFNVVLLAGVVVTFAAGNDGPPQGYRSLDNYAPFYLTVGASTIARGGLTLASSAGASRSAAASTNLTSSSATPSAKPSAGDSAPNVADFSSTGPLIFPDIGTGGGLATDSILKPDIVGPGVDLYAAAPGTRVGDKGGSAQLSGTSMATPHLAGIAALVMQKYPSWSPAQVMSAIMTTATTKDVNGAAISSAASGQAATPWDMGNGHVFPPKVLDPGLTYDARKSAYLNFLAGLDMQRTRSEYPNEKLTSVPPRELNRPTIALASLKGKIKVTRTVTCVADSASTYTAKIQKPNGVDVTVKPSSFAISPGQKVSFVVTFKVTKTSKNFQYGSLTWVDEKGHSVRSAIAVKPVRK